MSHWNRQLSAMCHLLFAATLVCRQAAAEDSSYGVQIDNSPAEEVVQSSSFDDPTDTESDAQFLLAQTQPPDIAEAEPTEPPPPQARSSGRRRRRTYRLPPMFGDIFDGGTYQALIQPAPIQIQQMIRDGQGGFNLFVTNNNGGNGADTNPAVVINIDNNGMLVASSIVPGTGPPGQPNMFQISEPMIPGISPPQQLGQGTLAYGGGTATYQGIGNPVGDGDNWGLDFSHTFTPVQVLVNVPVGGAVGREKIAENNSPEPRARIFWNYNFYNDVFGGIGDVNRNSVGMEQPLGDGMTSFEVRLPFAGTLDVDQVAGGPVARNTQFGDVTLIGKVLLTEADDYLVSAGLGLTIPTAEGSRVFTNTGTKIMNLDHQAVRILPFLACMHAYESGWYWQSFLQLDIAASGDPLALDVTGTNLTRVGVLQEPTLMFLDVGIGHWLMGGPAQGGPGVAATAELHYASTLQDADSINTNGLLITSAVNRYDLLNATLGFNIALNERVAIRPAMVIPLHDDQFDYEAMVQMNVWR